MSIYNKLYRHFGPRKWWPAKSPFEVMVGAILTQNTAWSNVEKAIACLKREKLISPQKMARVPEKKLRILIRSSGFYNEKAKKLKALTVFLFDSCKGRLKKLASRDTAVLRSELLSIKGVGPETADSILLYALEKSIFVVDAYTKRIFARHKLVESDAAYDEVQRFFMTNLPLSVELYNEYHALIVELGKNYCKNRKPRCKNVPWEWSNEGQIWYNITGYAPCAMGG